MAMAGGSGWVVSRGMCIRHGTLCVSSTWQLKPRSVITPRASLFEKMRDRSVLVEVWIDDWMWVIEHARSLGIRREFDARSSEQDDTCV